ncbi:MAG: helix-hairpin-helix domain-containing protein [Acidobacteria bacterium]|nr:helix-hairpin-helix domain-containing protein [Acidobacteriota bacterium]
MKRRDLRLLGTALLIAIATLAMLPRAAAATPPANDKININTAGVEELVTLPGIGRVYAERIVEYRQKNGPFKKVEDILNVRGVGEKTFEKIKDRLTVGKN